MASTLEPVWVQYNRSRRQTGAAEEEVGEKIDGIHQIFIWFWFWFWFAWFAWCRWGKRDLSYVASHLCLHCRTKCTRSMFWIQLFKSNNAQWLVMSASFISAMFVFFLVKCSLNMVRNLQNNSLDWKCFPDTKSSQRLRDGHSQVKIFSQTVQKVHLPFIGADWKCAESNYVNTGNDSEQI